MNQEEHIYHFDDCTKNPCICLDPQVQKELKEIHEQITKTYEEYIKESQDRAKHWQKQLQKHKMELKHIE